MVVNIAAALAVLLFGLLLAIGAASERRFRIRDSQLEVENVRLLKWLTTRKSIALNDIVQVQLDTGGTASRAFHNTWVKLSNGSTRVLVAGRTLSLAGQQKLVAGLRAALAKSGGYRAQPTTHAGKGGPTA